MELERLVTRDIAPRGEPLPHISGPKPEDKVNGDTGHDSRLNF
jgi:hypothetical protein